LEPPSSVSYLTCRLQNNVNCCGAVCDNYNLKSHNYVCITTYQSNADRNPNPNPTTKQPAIVYIQINIVTCPTYPDKFIRNMLRRHVRL